MANTESTGAAAAAHQKIDRISINQRAGIWRVSINGKFFGDYTRRAWALEAAFQKADVIAARNGVATVTWTMKGQRDAMLYDTRRPTPLEEAERVFERPQTRRWPLIGERFARQLLARAKA
jgi:hypothetical protein